MASFNNARGDITRMRNNPNEYLEKLTKLLVQDENRIQLLQTVQALSRSSYRLYVAAGFVRNLVWDSLHQYQFSTPLNDIDVIYFDDQVEGLEIQRTIEKELSKQHPRYHWQVKNQAVMHTRNGDKPYKSLQDAMSYWPEKETAIAVRLLDNDQIEIVHAFELESLFEGVVSYNSKRDYQIFLNRVNQKQWLEKWPKLQLNN